jgi:hypothetical protein
MLAPSCVFISDPPLSPASRLLPGITFGCRSVLRSAWTLTRDARRHRGTPSPTPQPAHHSSDRSHAPGGNAGPDALRPSVGAGLLANACSQLRLHIRPTAFASKPAPTGDHIRLSIGPSIRVDTHPMTLGVTAARLRPHRNGLTTLPIVPTLCVVTPVRTLRVPLKIWIQAQVSDAFTNSTACSPVLAAHPSAGARLPAIAVGHLALSPPSQLAQPFKRD